MIPTKAKLKKVLGELAYTLVNTLNKLKYHQPFRRWYLLGLNQRYRFSRTITIVVTDWRIKNVFRVYGDIVPLPGVKAFTWHCTGWLFGQSRWIDKGMVMRVFPATPYTDFGRTQISGTATRVTRQTANVNGTEYPLVEVWISGPDFDGKDLSGRLVGRCVNDRA